MKIAASAGVLGEKIMIDSTFNSLVNDQGIQNTVHVLLGHLMKCGLSFCIKVYVFNFSFLPFQLNISIYGNFFGF